jgi:FKBP-type peptidyl-prolyl cis-trans isomerase
MATKKSQRIGIWVIAIVMFVGTIGSFAVIVLANKNQNADQSAQAQALEAQKQQMAAAKKANKPLDGYQAAAFDPATVTDLKVETLKEGDGVVATANSSVVANYFGWTSDGAIFDSSNKNGVATPISFGLNQVIKGWSEGLTGVKAGSTVKLTIPADKAYGSVDTGTGAPTGPLVFIVELKEVK